MPNTRDFMYKNFIRRLNTTTPYKAESESTSAENVALTKDQGSAIPEADNFSIDSTYKIVTDSEGPDRQVISKMPNKTQRRIKQIKLFIEQVDLFLSRLQATIWELRPWREKSAIEIEQEKEMKERLKMQKTLRNEAVLFCQRASNAYARMGLCYIPPIHQRSFLSGIKKVQFSNVVAERNAIWLQIATDRLPWGVDILKLIRDEGILTNLSASLRHHVQGRYDVERGAWLCVERGRGVRGIPQEVKYDKMVNLIPKDSHGMTIPLGETVNSKRLYRNLKDFPHMLIAGSTGQGKTSYLNVIMACLIHNNTPDQIKIVLVDLKNGIEFDMYRGVPHLWKMGGEDTSDEDSIAPDGIVGRAEKVVMLLERLKREGERRLHRFREAGVTNIDEYNRNRGSSRISRIIIMIDEWARVALSPTGKQADDLMSEITATYRAVGFHVILATQMPIARVISTLIKTNFNARLAFGVPHNTASMVILDSIKAKGLEPVGRAVFQYGTQVVETQVPWIPKTELIAILDESRADGGKVEETLGTLEIFQYSLKHLNGSLDIRSLHQHFREKIGRDALIDKLKAMDELLVDVDGVEYEVDPPVGNVPRRLRLFKEFKGGEVVPIPPTLLNDS